MTRWGDPFLNASTNSLPAVTKSASLVFEQIPSRMKSADVVTSVKRVRVHCLQFQFLHVVPTDIITLDYFSDSRILYSILGFERFGAFCS
jgi:hypothetical protein